MPLTFLGATRVTLIGSARRSDHRSLSFEPKLTAKRYISSVAQPIFETWYVCGHLIGKRLRRDNVKWSGIEMKSIPQGLDSGTVQMALLDKNEIRSSNTMNIIRHQGIDISQAAQILGICLAVPCAASREPERLHNII